MSPALRLHGAHRQGELIMADGFTDKELDALASKAEKLAGSKEAKGNRVLFQAYRGIEIAAKRAQHNIAQAANIQKRAAEIEKNRKKNIAARDAQHKARAESKLKAQADERKRQAELAKAAQKLHKERKAERRKTAEDLRAEAEAVQAEKDRVAKKRPNDPAPKKPVAGSGETAPAADPKKPKVPKAPKKPKTPKRKKK
jgi:hypothetical protein